MSDLTTPPPVTPLVQEMQENYRKSKETLDFSSLSIIGLPVKNHEGKSFTLKEASGLAATTYRNALLASTTFEDGKVVKVRGMADAEPLLVSLCLFDDKGTPVPLHVLQSWPDRVTKPLAEKAKEISELKEEEDTVESLAKEQEELDKRKKKLKDDAAKNAPKSTEVGSG